MNAILQDTYDVNDDGGGHSSGDVAIDFFDAPTMFAERLVATDDADNDDPTEKLIHAIQALRDVIIDNTNVQQRLRARRAGGGGGGCGGSAAASAGIAGPGRAGRNHKTNNMFKDERLKIRSQKVSDSLDCYNFSDISVACQCCRSC